MRWGMATFFCLQSLPTNWLRPSLLVLIFVGRIVVWLAAGNDRTNVHFVTRHRVLGIQSLDGRKDFARNDFSAVLNSLCS